MNDIGELILMPSGDACFYCDDDHPTTPHAYYRARLENGSWVRGRRLTGVTSITKTLDIDPSLLLKWAARTNGIGITTLAAPLIMDLRDGRPYGGELDWLLNHEDIWQALEESKLTFEDVREERGVIGRNIHRYAFEALAKGDPVPHMDKLTTEEHGWAQGVIAFWLDHNPKPEQVEQIVVNNEMGVAGRLDFRGSLQTDCDDPACVCHEAEGVGIIDCKTGSLVGQAGHGQVQGYRLLAATSGFGPSEWGALLDVRGDGSYQLVRAEGTTDDFADALLAYRAAGRIKSAAMKAWKARR